MGNPFSYIRSLFGKKEVKILMLGLDAAGKTTIIFQLKLGLNVQTMPTLGFVYEQIEYQNFKMNVWDVAGQDSLRSLWKHYYQNTSGVIFVIDSADRERIGLAKSELHKLVSDDELKDCVLLVLANKQDLKQLTPREVQDQIDFESIPCTKKKVFGITASTGEGLTQAMDWFASQI